MRYAKFGHDIVVSHDISHYDRLAAVLDHECQNARRFDFLSSLEDWLVSATKSKTLEVIIRPWILSSGLKVLQSFSKPVSEDTELPSLIAALRKYGNGQSGLLLIERYDFLTISRRA